jgi:hypothetical protein
MTVQELINELQQVKNKNLQIVVRGTDPTDWIYNNNLEGVIGEKNVFYDNIDDCYYRRRLVLDGGSF